jgi:hypothetical protein
MGNVINNRDFMKSSFIFNVCSLCKKIFIDIIILTLHMKNFKNIGYLLQNIDEKRKNHVG